LPDGARRILDEESVVQREALPLVVTGLSHPLEKRMPHLAFGRLRPILDFRQQNGSTHGLRRLLNSQVALIAVKLDC
jgi:hypothetical protein